MLLNPLMFNCWCSVSVPLLLPELRCTLSLLRYLLEDCSIAPAAPSVLSLALAALLLLVPDCLRQLLLLRGRGCRCGCLMVQNLLHDPQHLCRCHGVVRLPEPRAQLPMWNALYLQPPTSSGQHHKITVGRTCTHRDVENVEVWRSAGALCHQTLLHVRKSHCLTPLLPPTCALPHVAAIAVCLPPPRALAPSAAVTVLRLSHSASASLFLLTHLLSRVLRGLCCVSCPTFSFLTAPPLRRHHAGPSAALARPASCEVDAARAPFLSPSSTPWLL